MTIRRTLYPGFQDALCPVQPPASLEWLGIFDSEGEPNMPQEISISYQAVKSKVYRLIDAMVEGSKTESEVRESMRRWWMLIHPADRPVAEKYLAMVLSRSNATLGAIGDGLFAVRDYKPLRAHDSEKVSKITASPTQFSRPF